MVQLVLEKLKVLLQQELAFADIYHMDLQTHRIVTGKPVFPAQAVQQQVGQRRPVFSVQDLFPKIQKETTKEEDHVEETKVETTQVLDKELGDGGQSSADKAESDQFDRDLALSSIEAGIDGLSVKDGKLSFDSKLDLGVLGTIGGFLPGPIGTGIGMAGAIGKGNLSSGLTAIGSTYPIVTGKQKKVYHL